MREIKFRGYQEAQEYFVYGQYLTGLLAGQEKHYIVRDDGFKYYIENPKTIGQYTGLKDKNGKEIYEGDIVRTSDYTEEKDIVIFEKGAFWCKDPTGRVENEVLFEFVELEVIGNIYENPEFLEVSE